MKKKMSGLQSGLMWSIWMAQYVCVCVCIYMPPKHECVYTGMCACVSFRKTICHSPQSEVWKRAPGYESALHSSPESLQFRKHLIPSLTLCAPVRGPRWRGIMKLFGRCSDAISHSHTNAHLTSELLSDNLVPKRRNCLTILWYLLPNWENKMQVW